ncbi:MAG: hypothetical protein QOK07_1733 [Gemmatimonadaceae bacterium]|jgi:hypothetical protein|nr:hypothetical protein [Gemmatimonadaceae bacterium]
MSHLSEEQLDQIIAEERAREQAPLNNWRTIAARAREEGLIRDSQSRSWVSGQPWIQAAAAMLLLVGGIAIGRTTIAIPSSAESGAASQQIAGSGSREAGSEATPGATTASNVAGFASVDDASATLDRALSDYQRASAFLAANSSGPTTVDSSGIYRTRLAALDKVNNAMESALRTAPHDPVINQYYLATMGARVATQQMAARPVGLALRGF